MSCEEASARALRERGFRLTPQRRLILAALRHANGHSSAQEIHDAVQAEYPDVDASTVYRTLTALRDAGLVSETDLGGGEAAFEWLAAERHHHLICQHCGEATALNHRYLQRLGDAVHADLGFKANLDHFAIFGTCASCAGTRPR